MDAGIAPFVRAREMSPLDVDGPGGLLNDRAHLMFILCGDTEYVSARLEFD